MRSAEGSQEALDEQQNPRKSTCYDSGEELDTLNDLGDLPQHARVSGFVLLQLSIQPFSHWVRVGTCYALVNGTSRPCEKWSVSLFMLVRNLWWNCKLPF